MLITVLVTNYLFMPAMYQQIATFGKMKPHQRLKTLTAVI